MTKGRKTSFEERVEIVQYCISHNRNYAETAVKYNVSYQQARSYTVKYEAGGVEALRDRRGRTKPEEEMSELEKLRAEKRRHVKRAAQTRLQHTGWNREPIYRRLYHSSQSHGLGLTKKGRPFGRLRVLNLHILSLCIILIW